MSPIIFLSIFTLCINIIAAQADKEEKEETKCHYSCKDHCRGSGPKDCQVCKEGFSWEPQYGCLDVDECRMSEKQGQVCPKNHLCLNSEGSYECYPCDPACNGCEGDGPDTCIKCAEGYSKKDNVCVSKEKKIRDKEVEKTRYITYFGLCLSTCIIFRKNIYIASIIGLFVAVYIGLAEYTVNTELPASETFLGSVTNKIFGMH